MNKGLIIGIFGIVIIAGAYFLLTNNQYKYIYQLTPNASLPNSSI